MNKLGGYTEYPRPLSKQIHNFGTNRRNLTGGYSRVKSVKDLTKDLPAYLGSDKNWMSTKNRGGTAPHIMRTTNPRKHMTSRGSQRKLKTVNRKDRLMSAKKHTPVKDDEEMKTLAYYKSMPIP